MTGKLKNPSPIMDSFSFGLGLPHPLNPPLLSGEGEIEKEGLTPLLDAPFL
jgi:hypothetical protein